mmetsp:Transcript_50751/g.82025  ORF Transcript_50751/g.82025 Transcript_50751/m.82025 type:complete len:89 (+) Transcript_50751:293-559(+)
MLVRTPNQRLGFMFLCVHYLHAASYQRRAATESSCQFAAPTTTLFASGVLIENRLRVSQGPSFFLSTNCTTLQLQVYGVYGETLFFKV